MCTQGSNRTPPVGICRLRHYLFFDTSAITYQWMAIVGVFCVCCGVSWVAQFLDVRVTFYHGMVWYCAGV